LSPEIAKEQGIGGVVIVKAHILADGSVDRAASSVYRTPSALLSTAAIDAVAATTYQPGMMNCIAVPRDVLVPVNFR